MVSWHIHRSGVFSFENRKKPLGAESDKYCDWAHSLVSCLATKSITIMLESIHFLPTNLVVYDKLLHAGISKRTSGITYWPFDPVVRIHDFTRFVQFWLIFGAPFARLLDSFDVTFKNLRLVTSNDALMHVGSSASLSSISFAISTHHRFLHKIQVFWYESSIETLQAQNITKKCWIDP